MDAMLQMSKIEIDELNRADEADNKRRKPTVAYQTAQVDGLSVFYREAGEPASPKLLLLGGFPASSHQFRNLIPSLADRFHVLSPDYPGFGNTDMPEDFEYTFDRLSEIVEGLLEQTNFRPFGLYMQDYGGPVGNRIVARHPDWLEWLVIQNSNAYEEGFTAAWDAIRHALWLNRSPETEEPLKPFLELEGVKQVYLHGHRDPTRISPDNWNMDLHFLERPGARKVQLDLFYDYRTNVALYPQWQAFLRERQPKTLILWEKMTFSSRLKAVGPTCETSRKPSCTCSTAGTSPWRTLLRKSRRTSSASTTTRSVALGPDVWPHLELFTNHAGSMARGQWFSRSVACRQLSDQGFNPARCSSLGGGRGVAGSRYEVVA
jgi:pimeloyl-ACP methyl ester carboxylesterase